MAAPATAPHSCTVRWRPSGGRGEYEVVPSHALVGRDIWLRISQLGVTIPTEITGTISQGKPRLRKEDPNNRSKLHLVPLVMAVARLPDPAREDKTGKAVWPLENKGFLVSHMDFRIEEADKKRVVLVPTGARILHSDESIDLQQRFAHVADDITSLATIQAQYPDLAAAIASHARAVETQVNDKRLSNTADGVIRIQGLTFGKSNTAAISTIVNLPTTPLEDDIKGQEGRVLTRMHSYRERDRILVKKAKALFKRENGKLYCECCGFDPEPFYGERGQDRIQAHHRRPVEELLPDSVTRAEDLAMVCANCHDVIHAKRPWLAVEELRDILLARGKHYSM
jgi:predicted HNH restriction endonuclease